MTLETRRKQLGGFRADWPYIKWIWGYHRDLKKKSSITIVGMFETGMGSIPEKGNWHYYVRNVKVIAMQLPLRKAVLNYLID